jgi:hypothetical protein
MAIDLYVLLLTPIFTIVGFASRVAWERYVKDQEAIRITKLSSISFKLNEFYYPIYMKLLKIDKIMTLLHRSSSGNEVDMPTIETIPYDFLWENYMEIQSIIEKNRSKANPGEDIDALIERFNEIVNYFQVWKVMNPEHYHKLLREGEDLHMINGHLYGGDPTSSGALLLDFHTQLGDRMIFLKEQYKIVMKPTQILGGLRNCCNKKDRRNERTRRQLMSMRDADVFRQRDRRDRSMADKLRPMVAQPMAIQQQMAIVQPMTIQPMP